MDVEVSLITGLMFGVEYSEFDEDDVDGDEELVGRHLVVDLGFVRTIFHF